MPEPLSDLEVLKQVANGNKRGLEMLYNRHSERTFKFLLRLTANRSAAEDLTHDVFLEVWKSAERFEGRALRGNRESRPSPGTKPSTRQESKERSPNTTCPHGPSQPPR